MDSIHSKVIFVCFISHSLDFISKAIIMLNRRYLMEDVDRQWKSHNHDGKETITWEEYRKIVYGFMDDMEPSELENTADEGFSYKDMIRRDQRRWGIADTNGDHALNKVIIHTIDPHI